MLPHKKGIFSVSQTRKQRCKDLLMLLTCSILVGCVPRSGCLQVSTLLFLPVNLPWEVGLLFCRLLPPTWVNTVWALSGGLELGASQTGIYGFRPPLGVGEPGAPG